jgi:zinc/manganese transport system permease protein
MEAFNFLVWPFLACLLLILIHAYFGIHILQRGIIFVDLALAQFISIGIAISFVFGEEKGLLLSVIFAFLGSIILAVSRKTARYVNIEAFIGVLYIFSFAAAVLILDRSPHGMEEFKTIMNGSIIWVTPKEILSTALLYGAVGALHFFLRRQFYALTFEGKGNFLLEFLFFASFAIVLVKSVHVAGILQVFSFLVIPALIGWWGYLSASWGYSCHISWMFPPRRSSWPGLPSCFSACSSAELFLKMSNLDRNDQLGRLP